jgi:hypothetical protein
MMIGTCEFIKSRVQMVPGRGNTKKAKEESIYKDMA